MKAPDRLHQIHALAQSGRYPRPLPTAAALRLNPSGQQKLDGSLAALEQLINGTLAGLDLLILVRPLAHSDHGSRA